MRLLLDTNVVISMFGRGRPVSSGIEEQLLAADEVLVSVVAFVEIGIKAGLRRLPTPDDLEDQLRSGGAVVLAITPGHGLALAALPLHHRDPFDRLLIAQAQAEDLVVVTSDRAFGAYDVRTLDPFA